MFEQTAEAITHKLRQVKSIKEEQFEICKFGIIQLLNIILNVLTTIVLGLVLDELYQALFFLFLYIPLRSNAGGYHAKTPFRCYLYSIILMITILLAIKLIHLNWFACVIALGVSSLIIVSIAPVEDFNKPLDTLEKKVYRKRTIVIVVIQSLLFITSILFNLTIVMQCLVWVYITMAFMLYIGKYKNESL